MTSFITTVTFAVNRRIYSISVIFKDYLTLPRAMRSSWAFTERILCFVTPSKQLLDFSFSQFITGAHFSITPVISKLKASDSCSRATGFFFVRKTMRGNRRNLGQASTEGNMMPLLEFTAAVLMRCSSSASITEKQPKRGKARSSLMYSECFPPGTWRHSSRWGSAQRWWRHLAPPDDLRSPQRTRAFSICAEYLAQK